MLHLAGPDVQDLFLTLPNTADVKDYRKAYFAPKVDSTYARHCFRQLVQEPGETIRPFATRLRRASKDCDYGEDTDNQISDEILGKCTSTYIKRKLLEERQGLTLARALEIAENCEKVDAQLAAMTIEEKGENSASVNRIEGTKRGHGKRNQSRGTKTGREKTCHRRGSTGHFGRDSNCPARCQFCHRCGLEGHFQEQCRTKQKDEEKQKQTKGHRNPKGGGTNMVGCHDKEEEPVYAFTVGGTNEEKIEVTVGGCKLNMIIDSGASTNIIDKETWEWLKKNKVKCESARSSRKLYAYASQTPLDVIGTFSCEVSAGSNTASAKFCVINGEGDPLLGKDTATSLGVLKIGIGIAAVSADPKTIGGILQQKYPNVFSGVGKLKDRAVQLHIDPNVTPVA